jgi:hypothetical protein
MEYGITQLYEYSPAGHDNKPFIRMLMLHILSLSHCVVFLTDEF